MAPLESESESEGVDGSVTGNATSTDQRRSLPFQEQQAGGETTAQAIVEDECGEVGALSEGGEQERCLQEKLSKAGQQDETSKRGRGHCDTATGSRLVRRRFVPAAGKVPDIAAVAGAAAQQWALQHQQEEDGGQACNSSHHSMHQNGAGSTERLERLEDTGNEAEQRVRAGVLQPCHMLYWLVRGTSQQTRLNLCEDQEGKEEAGSEEEAVRG